MILKNPKMLFCKNRDVKDHFYGQTLEQLPSDFGLSSVSYNIITPVLSLVLCDCCRKDAVYPGV